ncbi:MAG: VOC family protein [Trebonia sp.]
MTARVTGLLMGTATTPKLSATTDGWTAASRYEVVDRYPVDEPLAALWGIKPGAHTAAVVTRAPGTASGMVRWVDSAVTDRRKVPVETPGPFAFEFFANDVDGTYQGLADSDVFTPLAPPTTYDLHVIGSGICRSFAVRGPGDFWAFITTIQQVPPPRELPVTPHYLSPVVNMPIATTDGASAVALYRDVLGIPPRLDGPVQDAGVNAIMCAPPDWAFHITVFFIGDGMLCEHHIHPEGRLTPTRRPSDALRSGPAVSTLLVDDLEAIIAAATAAGIKVRGPVTLDREPYGTRRVACVDGPNNEIVELVQA